MNKNFKETSKTGAVLWLLQRISAVVLFVILIIHFVTYHFISKGLTPPWKDVVAKMQSPWFNLFQFIFLVCALFHGLNGIWMVSEDYIHSRFWRIVIFSLILLVGLSLLFIGTITIIKISSLDLTKFGV